MAKTFSVQKTSFLFAADGSSGFHCDGSLINNRYVLTAAHCLKMPKGWNFLSVRSGEHDLGSERDCDLDEEESCLPPVQDIEIAEIIIHSEYKTENSYPFHDIALLRLKQIVEFNDFVKPVCLPLAKHLWNKDYTGEHLVTAGWGKTQTYELNSQI